MEPSGLAFGKPKDKLRDIRELCPRISLRSMRATSLHPAQLRAAEALRHCAMLSAMIFIDAAAVWLTVA